MNKVFEAGVKLLKCWKQLHLSNKDKCTFRERKEGRKEGRKKQRKKERKTQTNKQQQLISRESIFIQVI